MVKNFLIKRGDQLAFTITFTSSTPVTAMEFGVKERYSDSNYTIVESLYEIKRKVVFIGDSYAQGWTPDGDVIGWPQLLKDSMNLNSIIRYKGGTGFSNTLTAGTFQGLLSDISSDTEVTDVIVAGGYNDRYGTRDTVLKGMNEFCSLAKSKFPNAAIKIGMIGWSSHDDQKQSLRNTIAYYKEGCIANDVAYMEDAENSIHNNEYFASDGVHPNQNGENAIANNIALYIPAIYGGGIQKLSDSKYLITVASEKTAKLLIKNYVYDLRMKIGNIVRTPLSGKLMIKDTVFED